MLNVSERLTTWQQAQSAILRQEQHGWLLNNITREQAEQAIQDAQKFAADLRRLAGVIDQNVEQANERLE